MSVLLLNATFEPLRVVSWQRAFVLVFSGKADLIESDADTFLSTSGGDIYELPIVVRLRQMAKIPFVSSPPLNGRTLAARDGHVCQVVGCNERGTTIDHVVPRCRGGAHAWENVTLMCFAHNNKKGDRNLSGLGWELKSRPYAPRATLALSEVARNPRPEWVPYLGLSG